jgi:hypothetical protein
MADHFQDSGTPSRAFWRGLLAPAVLIVAACIVIAYVFPARPALEIPAADVPTDVIREKVEWPVVYDFPVTEIVIAEPVPPTVPAAKSKARRKPAPQPVVRAWYEELADDVGWNSPPRPWAPNLHLGWPN